jgi:hypothetical protein
VDGDEGPVIVDHRRWDSWERQMVPCEGSQKPPSEMTT